MFAPEVMADLAELLCKHGCVLKARGRVLPDGKPQIQVKIYRSRDNANSAGGAGEDFDLALRAAVAGAFEHLEL